MRIHVAYWSALLVAATGCQLVLGIENVEPPLSDAGNPDPVDAGMIPPVQQVTCDPLPPATGNTTTVQNADDLRSAVQSAGPGTTILLADGDYALSGSMTLRTPGVTIRSASGDPSAVRISGEDDATSVFFIVTSDITIADITMTRTESVAVQVAAEARADTSGIVFYNVRFVDIPHRAIRIRSYKDYAGMTQEPGQDYYVDNGMIACSHFELTDDFRDTACGASQFGIEARATRGWVVSGNTFKDLYCPGKDIEALEFSYRSRDTIIENNRFINGSINMRIGWQIGQPSMEPSYPLRSYPDNPGDGMCVDPDHFDGVIRNNEIFADEDHEEFDRGIMLWQACGTWVAHNTIVSPSSDTSSSIEYRFDNTWVRLVNNLVSHEIVPVDGGRADPLLLPSNVTPADRSWFVDAASGDLHLEAGAAAPPGRSIMPPDAPEGLCDVDMEGRMRDLSQPDVGAHERQD